VVERIKHGTQIKRMPKDLNDYVCTRTRGGPGDMLDAYPHWPPVICVIVVMTPQDKPGVLWL
jgi:hypothetical protein